MKRILIVDDKDENLYYLDALLTGHGYVVTTARHGAEALVKARVAPPDLVISDLLMPVMDGYTLLRHWKADARLRSAPFIVYTATYTEVEDERLAFSLGADAFILKPAEPDDFLARVRSIEDGQAAVVPTVPQEPTGDENSQLKFYSETLIRKLEEKTLLLEEANRSLQNDIAVRQRAEETLAESEKRFRQLAENINEVFWLTDTANGHLLYVSPAFETIWGRPCAELQRSPQRWLEAIHPGDRERVAAATARQASGGYDETYRVVRPDGTERWVHDRAFPVRNEAGEVYRVVGTAEDITERERAEKRIAEQAALLDKASDAILVCDLAHTVRYWNEGAARLYGWSAAESVGKILDALIEINGPDPEAWRAVLRDGEWSGELRHRHRAGTEVIVAARLSLMRDVAGRPKSVLAINTDVTERKKIEAQFLRAQRLESIGTLAGGVAHDLNNMLSPIIMGVSLLKQSPLPVECRPVVEAIERSAQRGTNLVKQVLSFARGTETPRAAVKIAEVVGEFAAIASTTFPKNITVQTDIPADLAPVLGNPTQLQQVLLNLGVNARDAMPSGGKLCIGARRSIIATPHSVMNGVVPPGNYVVLTVTDGGTGMPPHVLERIFEPFYTTKAAGSGTGLGLSTTHAIMRGHGGFIDVRSTPGAGTTFELYLPSAEVASGGSIPPFAAGLLPRGHGELVLLVDDESSILTITRQTLEAFGYRVLTADDGAQAIGLFALNRTEIAVVITDMMMPVMDGTGLAAALHRLDPGVPMIAISGLNTTVAPERLARVGIAHSLAKPFTTEALLHLLHKILSGRPTHSSP